MGVVSRNLGAPGSDERAISTQHAPIVQDGRVRSPDDGQLSSEELEAQHAADLPDREAMTLIGGPLPPTVAPFEPPPLGFEHTMPINS